jgi:hypothetical protein
MMLLLVSTIIKFLSIVKGSREVSVVSDGGLQRFCRYEHYNSLVLQHVKNKKCWLCVITTVPIIVDWDEFWLKWKHWCRLYQIFIFSQCALDFQGFLHLKNFLVILLLTQGLVIQGGLEVTSGSVKLFGVLWITGSVHEEDLLSDPTSVHNK